MTTQNSDFISPTSMYLHCYLRYSHVSAWFHTTSKTDIPCTFATNKRQLSFTYHQFLEGATLLNISPPIL